MDVKAVQDLGLTVFVTVSVLSSCFWLVKKIVDIGDKHLTDAYGSMQKLIDSHLEERSKWLAAIEKYTEKIDRAMEYQRQEHAKQMEQHILTIRLLQDIEERLEKVKLKGE